MNSFWLGMGVFGTLILFLFLLLVFYAAVIHMSKDALREMIVFYFVQRRDHINELAKCDDNFIRSAVNTARPI